VFIPNFYVIIFIVTFDDQLLVEVALLMEVPLYKLSRIILLQCMRFTWILKCEGYVGILKCESNMRHEIDFHHKTKRQSWKT
jgi:hypothetical protein